MKTSSKKWQKIRKIKGLRQFVTWYPRHVSENPGCNQYSHDGEYVVVGRQGALCGNVRLIQGQNYLSEHAIAVRANEENETKFLLYLLDFMKLGQYSDQGAQPGLAVNKLLKLKCTVPEKKIQLKIASFLLAYDKQIATQENILSLLTDQRKAFLQQLFI